MKAPAFQFYVRDWLSDPQLRMASHQTKGIWIDMICFMWEAPERGVITGKVNDICRMIGLKSTELDEFLVDAQRLDFASVRFCQDEVRIENRRMVRDSIRNKNNAIYQARHRSKQESKTEVSTLSSSSSSSSKKKSIKKETRKRSLTDEEYFAILKTNPAYQGIDIDKERGKCEAWCLTNSKVFSRRRFVNWLNRAEKPMNFRKPDTNNPYRRSGISPLEQMKADEERMGEPKPEDIGAVKNLVSELTKKVSI